jgi:hypothetical protein
VSKRTYVEVTCDHCGSASHYLPGAVVASARADGWIVTHGGRHYCSIKCYDAARAGTKISKEEKA